jgi:hypothetical protein
VTGKTNTFYRITFKANSCSYLTEAGVQIVQESEKLQQWDNWITTKANKSLVGMGRGANLRGAAIAVRSNEGSGNHIYRNLAIYDVNPHLIEGGDGLETIGTASKHINKFWADHISYKWISDGMDMEFVDNATISYLDFDGANEYNCWGTDPYMALVEDAHLTYANNYWHNTYGRVPKVTGENLAAGTHSAVAVVTDNSGLTWMSEFVTFTVEGAAVSSSSEAVSSSSSSVHGPAESSSSSVIPGSSSSVILSEVEGSSRGFHHPFA